MSLRSVGRWGAVAFAAACAVWAQSTGLEFPILYSFSPFSSPNGLEPHSTLVQGADGHFYGTNFLGGTYGRGTVFRMSSDGAITTLVSFDGANGSHPQAGVIEGSDGNLYGTTTLGGSRGHGTVFRLTPGGALTTLVSFDAFSTGNFPVTRLLQAADGNFYGTTNNGGTSAGGAGGTVFRVTPEGQLTVLVRFDGNNGLAPLGDLVQAADGNLYGTTLQGGPADKGTVFRLSLDGTLTTLAAFAGADGAFPVSGLVQAADGNFYGASSQGGSADKGTLFRMTPAGALATLVNFTGTNGRNPRGELIQAADGKLYGMTHEGGAYDSGTIFSVTTGGTLATLVDLDNEFDGAFPEGGLLQAADGKFYGTTQRGGRGAGGTAFSMTGDGALATLARFSSARPGSRLIQGTDGKFYGTTFYGGTGGQGTVYRTTVDGNQETIANFDGDNGAYPMSGVMQAADGNFYGTTQKGGSADLGTVFRLTPDGTLTTLVHFTGSNGSTPFARLIQGSDGNFYGTTQKGGANQFGTLFRMTADGTLTTLSHLSSEGSFPDAPLVQGADGNFYGTTSGSFDPDSSASMGDSVFRMTPAGVVTTLVRFTGANGANPTAGLVQGLDGALYGTTVRGGENDVGTVFRVATDGTFTTLRSFSSGVNGARPAAGLLRAADGGYYGTTTQGGAGDGGTIFRIDVTGILITLVQFNGVNGWLPESELIQALDGDLYGTTSSGGDQYLGTVYRLDIIPDPFTLLDQVGVEPGTLVTSEPVTIEDIEVPVAVSVENGEYSVGCTGTFTTAPANITAGEAVCVRQVAASAPDSAATTILKVGSVSEAFTTTTRGVDEVPDPFSFVDRTDVEPGSLVTSNAVVITGIETAVPIEVTGGEYSIGCTASFTAEPGTIGNGTSVCVRHFAATTYDTVKESELNVGGVTGRFKSKTRVNSARDGGGYGGSLEIGSLLTLLLCGACRRRVSRWPRNSLAAAA